MGEFCLFPFSYYSWYLEYLHKFLFQHKFYFRYYDHITQYGMLKKGREVMLTGCCLRTAMEGSGHARILPTEYMVILLDEVSIECIRV
jgi:hypothetical protein